MKMVAKIRVRDEMEWTCLCWPFGEWPPPVAFAAPLAPFGHCGEAARKQDETRPLAHLKF
jgi:hypothetical protein